MDIRDFIAFLKPLDYLPHKWKYRHVCQFGSHVKLKDTVLEGFNSLGKNVYVRNCHIGYGSYISPSTRLSGTRIGRFCSIGANVEVILGVHPTTQNITTSPLMYKNVSHDFGRTLLTDPTFDDSPKHADDEGHAVVIENDVWIGSHVLIMHGVTIHNGAIIGAGAIVTKDVPPYTISVGAPAKVIKKRFSDQEIDTLQNMRWWEQTDNETLRQYATEFCDPEQFFPHHK